MPIRDWIDRWGDWALTAVLAAAMAIEVQHPPAGMEARVGHAALTVGAVLLVLPLAWRRRAPLAVLAAMLGWFACMALVVVTASPGSPLTAVVALGVAFYTVGAQTAGRRSVIGFGGGLAALIAIDVAGGGVFQAVGVRPGVWLLMTVAWLGGRELRRRRLEMQQLRARAAAVEQEREERLRIAAAEERSRIARELHDVVAHSVSVMVVQSQAAQRVLERGSRCSAAMRFASIETTGRQALTELRRLLGLLREADEGPSLVPQPSLQYLDELLAQIRDAGLPVELTVEGTPTALPQGVDLSAYRIVQEGLTNSLKHAGAAPRERARSVRVRGARDRDRATTAAARRRPPGTVPDTAWSGCASGSPSTAASCGPVAGRTAGTWCQARLPLGSGA